MLFDTHAHINFNAYKDDADEVIKRALDQDVWLINVGSQYDTSCRAIDYAQKYQEGVYAAIGLHPHHLEEMEVDEKETGVKYKTRKEEFDFEKYWDLAQKPKMLAIGEIGLDYKLTNSKQQTANNKEKQKEVLIQQLEMAQQLNLPVILHCREAYDDLIEILENFKSGCVSCDFGCPGAGVGNLRGVIHCFGGDLKTAQQFLEMDFYLGFNGLITFSEQYDQLIKEIPLEKILLETDCPYLAPVPFRGQRNEPAYIKFVAQKIAEIKGITFEEVAEQTTKNARELFNL